MAAQNTSTVMTAQQWASAQGLSFVACTATPGTGIATGLSAAYSATANGFVCIANNYPAAPPGGGAKYLIVDSIKAQLSVTGSAPATTTSLNFWGVLDTLARLPSAGSVLLTPHCVNGGAADGTMTTVYVPTGGVVMTIPAATTASRPVHRGSIPTSLGIVGDSYNLYYGIDAPVSNSGFAAVVRATDAATFSLELPAIVIPPQWCYVLSEYWLTATTNTPYFEYEIRWKERFLP